MASKTNPFAVDRLSGRPEYLHVHVREKATVIIKDEEEGVVADIYPFKQFDSEPAATTWAHVHDLSPEEQPPMPALTEWQRTALESYDLGEFRYLAETPTHAAFQEELRHCGDSLLRFIVSELSEKEDCSSIEDAIRRMTVARNQLNDLIEDLQDAVVSLGTAGLPFTARWLVELDAATPQDAAKQAFAMQRDPTSTATHFTVRDNATGETTDIDLLHAGKGG